MKFKLTKEEFEKLSDDFKAEYKADGDNYILQGEGFADKTKLEEFRMANTELLKTTKGLEGIDMAKYNSMLETERKIRDKELIAKGDIETLIAERLATSTSDFNGKLKTAQELADSATSKHSKLVSKYEIEGAALKAFGAHKIRPDAHDAIMAQIKSKFSVDESGKVIAKEGDSIVAGKDGNLTVSEFVESQPDFMRVPNTPGGGQGGEDQTVVKPGTSSQDKIKAGLAKALGKTTE